MKTRTPLAWNNLTHDLRRFLVAVSGVSFAVFLIFMQLGFLNALLESTVQIIRKLNGDLIILSSAKYALPVNERFSLRRLQQAEGHPGIRSIYPVYIETRGILRHGNSRSHPIRVLAFHADQQVFDLRGLAEQSPELRYPGTALVDVASRKRYRIPSRLEDVRSYRGELSRKRIRLAGQFRLGVDFATNGNLIMTAANFADYFPERVPGGDPLSVVDLAIVKLDQGTNPVDIQQTLQLALPDDVDVVTKQQLIEREMTFWRTSAPVGYIFLVGVYMGFVVGVIICYQIIYTDIADHMSEFATLKAMGYTKTYFYQLILTQSIYLSVMGFLPGLAFGYVCYLALSAVTGLTMQLTIPVIVLVFGVTMLMCGISGLLALRKLIAMDPADLF